MMETKKVISDRMPASVKALSGRKGALLPAGAVLYAEGDTRNFHELLFIWHGILCRQDRVLEGTSESFRGMLSYYATRFQGWYELPELSEAIEQVLKEADFNDRSELLDRIEKLMGIAGDINSWIDLLIPWHRINGVMQSEPEKSFQEM